MSRPRAATIAEIKKRHSIVEVLDQLGIHPPGRWNGSRDFMISCPCHEDSTPSCVIHPATDRYHCFGCGVHGDVIQLVQDVGRATNVSEALAFLAGQSGVAAGAAVVRPVVRRVEVHTSSDRVLEVNEAAWTVMTEGTATRRAERYLATRGIDVGALHRMTSEPLVGSTPAARDGLIRALASAGFSDHEIFDAGWMLRRGDGAVDRFHRRVVFPIRDEANHVVGITARDLTGMARAKYLNTPSTSAFRKGETLYKPVPLSGDPSSVVVVEGPVDALAVTALMTKGPFEHQPTQVVALCGTAMTPHQASMIARLGGRLVTTMPDADPAGIEAAKHWSELLRQSNCALRAIQLPAGQDPASLIVEPLSPSSLGG